MNIIDQNKTSIVSLAKSHGVSSISVFGSVLTNRFKPTSDIDVLVKFEGVDLYNYFDNYIDLKEKLETILKRDVDLVEEQTVKNPILKRVIERTKKVIWTNA